MSSVPKKRGKLHDLKSLFCFFFVTRWLPHRVSVMEGLAIFLMCERCRGNTSSWHPYIQSLPSSYTDATWWSEQQIHQLPDHVEELARLRQQAARDSYQYVQPLLQILQQQETGLTGIYSFSLKPFCAGIDFRHKNMTSIDVRF